jgi:hypothetical protein
MNIQPSDAELRFQTQQITAAQESQRNRPTNPFAAAFGIGVVAAIIWSLYAAAEFIGRVTSSVLGWL